MTNVIPTTIRKFETVAGFQTYLASLASDHPNSYRQFVRLGVLPNGAIMIETTTENLRVGDKIAGKVTAVPEIGPDFQGATQITAIQRAASGQYIITADDRNLGNSLMQALTEAVMSAYKANQIIFAGGPRCDRYSWVIPTGLRNALLVTNMVNVVAIPANMDGGLIGHSNREPTKLFKLSADLLERGEANRFEAWRPIANFDSPIKMIGYRFRGKYLTVSLVSGIEVVNCANLATNNVSLEAAKVATKTFAAEAPIEGTDYGLFRTQKEGAATVARFIAPIDEYGLPTTSASF